MMNIPVIHGAGMNMRGKVQPDFPAKYLQPVVVRPMR